MTDPTGATIAVHPVRSIRRVPRAPLQIAIATASALTVIGGLVLASRQFDQDQPVAWLVALACVCLALLAERRAPGLAWVSAVAASYAASTLVFGVTRDLDPLDAGFGRWLPMAITASSCAIATTGIAAGYAARPGRRVDPIALPVAGALIGWVAIGCLVTVAVVAGGGTADPAFTWVDIATAPTTLFLPIVLLLTTFGIAADVRSARDRARDRVGPRGNPSTARDGASWRLVTATARELIPGQGAVDQAAHEAERTKLAGDLHAAVLPALRRAIAAAEAGGDADELARRLRLVDLELERLMADRWPVVLEAFGLIAAVEDLAERLEREGAAPVTIDVHGIGDRPPARVERAAWRFVQVALDNAVRHAEASAIGVSLSVESTSIWITVADDGRGYDVAAPGRAGARGIRDARHAAAEIGASVEIRTSDDRGAIATFRWLTPPS